MRSLSRKMSPMLWKIMVPLLSVFDVCYTVRALSPTTRPTSPQQSIALSFRLLELTYVSRSPHKSSLVILNEVKNLTSALWRPTGLCR
jgi:hypothetical protein